MKFPWVSRRKHEEEISALKLRVELRERWAHEFFARYEQEQFWLGYEKQRSVLLESRLKFKNERMTQALALIKSKT
jgi:hypothetical protein